MGAWVRTSIFLVAKIMSLFAAGNTRPPQQTAVRLGQRPPQGGEVVTACSNVLTACVDYAARELHLRRHLALQILFEGQPQLLVEGANVLLDFSLE